MPMTNNALADMTIEVFEEGTEVTASYPGVGGGDEMKAVNYCLVGMAGEGGEALNKWKKMLRSGQEELSDDDRDALIDELGDTLWYTTRALIELGTGLQDAMWRNREKLQGRMEENTITQKAPRPDGR